MADGVVRCAGVHSYTHHPSIVVLNNRVPIVLYIRSPLTSFYDRYNMKLWYPYTQYQNTENNLERCTVFQTEGVTMVILNTTSDRI